METKLTDNQQDFATKNHNLIYSYAIKMNLSIDEYYDVLAIGYCKAVSSYNDNKGKFSTYAYICMRNELFQSYRKENKYSNDLQLDRDLQDNEIVSYEDKELDMINVANLKNLVNCSSKLEQEIIRLKILGLSQTKIGERVGMSQAQISRIIKKLKLKYEEMRKVYDR